MASNRPKPDKIVVKYYVAGDHYYPQVFFRHWESIKEMIEVGAKKLGYGEVNFEEIKSENN